jgi:sulfonate transport system substrate-binding protein
MSGPAMHSRIVTIAGLALALLATACQKDPASQVTLHVADRTRNLRLVAEASGAFEGSSYKVEWADFSTMTPLFEALDAGAVDVAGAIDNLGIQAGIRGQDMKIVAAGQSSAAGDALIVPKDSPIRSVVDLKGRQVIVSTIRGGTADAVLIGALAEAGLGEKDVKIGYMAHSDALAAFLSGKIDAWATNDPYYAKAQEAGARLLRDGVGLRNATSYMLANGKALKDPARRAAIGDFLVRFAKARQWGNEHIVDYAAQYARSTGMPPSLAAKILKRQSRQSFGPITDSVVADAQKLADDYARRDLFPKNIRVAAFFDPSVFGAKSNPPPP